LSEFKGKLYNCKSAGILTFKIFKYPNDIFINIDSVGSRITTTDQNIHNHLIKILDVNYVLNDESFSFEVFHTKENKNFLKLRN
jgi:hypothetical protein